MSLVAFPADMWSVPSTSGGNVVYRDAPSPTGNLLTPNSGFPALTDVWEEVLPTDATTPAYRLVCPAGRLWPRGRVF